MKDWMIKEFGKTRGCDGCRGVSERHNEVCRARITPLVEAKMQKQEQEQAAAAADARVAVGVASNEAPRSVIDAPGPSFAVGAVGAGAGSQEGRGVKGARAEADGDVEMDGVAGAVGSKKPRVIGFDDEPGPDDMIASLLEMEGEEMIGAIFAVLDDEPEDLGEFVAAQFLQMYGLQKIATEHLKQFARG